MSHSLSRRSFLGAAATGAAGLALQPVSSVLADEASSFEVALQGYSLEEFNLPSLLSVAQNIGVDRLELFDDQFSVFMSERDRERVQTQLKATGISVPATYTGHFGPDEAANREIFAFGRQMDLQFFSCTPTEETLRVLNRLVPEYEIGIALHNPGPGPDESYVELETVANVLDRFEHIGACVDVGNFARADVDPIEALRRLRGQIHELHVKDVTAKGEYTLLGDGIIDLEGVFAELRDANFDGLLTLEYGAHPNRIDTRMKKLRANVKRLKTRVD